MAGELECEKPNRLAGERSPYLRQHACNPVDWRPWGPEALREAREKGKPLFISIGYSSCHWCHVMEREVFRDTHVAEVLNRVFINVKVDREERPDVDQYYMYYCQVAGRGCGWPLNVFALPDGRPFYTFTYANRDQLLQLALSLENAWRSDPQQFAQVADKAQEYLDRLFTPPPASQHPLEKTFLKTVRRELERTHDRVNGGFGYRPKFPLFHALVFLTREKCLEPDPDIASRLQGMVTHSLDSMLRGGVYDLVGGGIHRYSVDEEWLVPHFEKMLYDQAGLIEALVEAGLAWGRGDYLERALEVRGFLEREMWSGMAFYSSIDADSGGEEGLYYTYTLAEVEEALGDPKLLEIAKKAFNLRKAGNYLEEYTELPNGRNIIRLAKPPEKLAGELSLTPQELEETLKEILRRLREYREQRKPRPAVDTKTLVDWNMMTISSLSQLHRATGDPASLDMARRAYEYLHEKAKPGPLYAHQPGEEKPGPIDDQAHALKAALDLHQATLEEKYLEQAREHAHALLGTLVKPDGTVLYLPPGQDSPLAGRAADSFDPATASPIAVLAEALWRLGFTTGEEKLTQAAVGILKRYAQRARKYPQGHIGMALPTQRLEAQAARLVITPQKNHWDNHVKRIVLEETGKLWKRYRPFLETLPNTPSLTRIDPSLKTMPPKCNGVTLYLCWKDRCDFPTCNWEKVDRGLERMCGE